MSETRTRTEGTSTSAVRAPLKGRRFANLIHPTEVAVFAAYAAAAILLPTGIDVPILDDGIYVWMAERFAEGHLSSHPVSAAAAMFETVAGGALLRVLGGGIGMLRWGSVLLTLVGGVAMSFAASALGIVGWRRALVAGTYLFNPLSFVFTFTFMTDAHALALAAMTIALWLWALRRPSISLTLLALGSVAALASTMSRQPMLALPLAGAATIVLKTDVGWRRKALAVAVVTLPTFIITVVHQVWLSAQPDVAQSNFFDSLRAMSLYDLVVFVEQVGAMHIPYVAAMLLPLGAAVALLAPSSVRSIRRSRALGFALIGPFVGAAIAALPGGRFPYAAAAFDSWGLGAWDINGTPATLFTTQHFYVFTVVLSLGLMLIGIVAFDRWPRPRAMSAGETLCVAFAAAAVLLAVPPSAGFRHMVTLDRYLLPATVPVALLLARAIRDRAVPPLAPMLVLVGLATFSVTATYDHLSFHRAIGELEGVAIAEGAVPGELDAGPGYAAYWSANFGDRPATTNPLPTWWSITWGSSITGEWVISANPVPGYAVVSVRSYPTILQTKPSALYLLHAED